MEPDFTCPPLQPLYSRVSNSLFEQNALVIIQFAFIGALTVALLQAYDHLDRRGSPTWWPKLVKTWPLLGVSIYVPIGYLLHFYHWHGNTCIVPPNGTWGWWYLPGSPKFHVQWTGLVEIVGGLGLAYGGMRSMEKLQRRCAAALFLLTIGMTFANAYTLTHGAAPFEVNEPIKLGTHIVRHIVQALWLSNLAYMARHDGPLGQRFKAE